MNFKEIMVVFRLFWFRYIKVNSFPLFSEGIWFWCLNQAYSYLQIFNCPIFLTPNCRTRVSGSNFKFSINTINSSTWNYLIIRSLLIQFPSSSKKPERERASGVVCATSSRLLVIGFLFPILEKLTTSQIP